MKNKPRNVIGEFNLLNNISLLFGVGMMFNSKAKIKTKLNIFLLVCNICIIVLANTIDSTHPALCIQKSVPIAISKLKQALGIISSASIYFQVICHKRTISSTVIRFRSADLIFSNLNVRFSYNNFNFVVKLSVVAAFLLNFVVFAVLLIHYEVSSFEKVFLNFVANIHPMLLIYILVLLDIYLCWLIRIRFCALSLLLTELCEFKDTVGDKSNWKVKLIQENPKIFFTDLIKISEIYEILYEIIGDLNSAFGLSCLCSIALESISLTCHVFLLFKAATSLTNEGMKMEILAQVLWILLFLIPLMLLIFVYYSTVLEANSVSMVLHETVAGKRIESSIMQLEMDLISLQLLHQQPYFSACGFFNIDMTLAYAIVGTVTTYLVILLQFNSE